MSNPIVRTDLNHSGQIRSSQPNRPVRLAFYSHDTMGMGHIRRNLLIATAIVRDCPNVEILLIAGTREAAFFATEAGLDCVTLPALTKSADGRYSARHLGWSLEETTRLRSRIIQAAMEEFSPDVFVVDKLPRGIGHELVPTLGQLRRTGTKCVLGLRDVLDEPTVVAREWQRDSNDQAIEEFYDELWIYGDQSVYDCLKEYSFTSTVSSRAFFTGYLNQTTRGTGYTAAGMELPSDNRHVLCVVGGGQDGFQLAKAFAQVTLPENWQGSVITGPFMPKADLHQLHQLAAANGRVEIIDRLVETDDYMRTADRVIAMGGYNTVTSILSFNKPALIVPRVTPRQEQWIRAERLANRGWVSVIKPQDLDHQQLNDWLQTSTVPQPESHAIDLHGLSRISQRVNHWTSQQAVPTV